MALLRFMDQESHLQMRALDSEHFIIGRADSCQLTFDDDLISREHLRIDLEREGRFRIRDLGSRNKTYVNGEIITETLLNPGDIIRVGEFVLEFVDDTAPAQKISLDFLTPDRHEPPHCDWIKTKAPLSLAIGQVEALTELFGEQPLTARAEDIAGMALSRVILEVKAERGFVALRGESKMDLIPLAQRALVRSPGETVLPVSQSFALAPVLQSVSGLYPQTAGKIDLKSGFASTAIVAPLIYRGDVVGVLYVDRPQSKRPLSSAALQYCIAAGAVVGAQVAAASRKLTQAAVREGAAWMTTIRRVQRALSPVPASNEAFDVAVKCFPGRARCGDFADVIHIDGQRCCMFVVDAGGHGITGITQASSMIAAVRTALSVTQDALMDPAPMFDELNRMIASMATRQILPCTYVGIDMAAGKIAYINAGGMPPLLMIGSGRLITLDQPSLVLGVDPDYVYEYTRADIPEAFRVICHTDGVPQAVSTAGEPMGDQRLHELLLDRELFRPADELLAKITSAWEAHLSGAQPDDDALFLVLSHR